MLTTILLMTFMSSMLFLQTINPLTLGLILVFQTLITAMFLGSMTKTFWIMYLLMLTFIGGMLVLFIYVTSIFPNEKFTMNQTSFLAFIFIMITLLLLMKIYTIFFNINLTLNDQMFTLPYLNKNINYTTKMFYTYMSLILLFLVIYLFYCMLVVIKITNFYKGPLRKMN